MTRKIFIHSRVMTEDKFVSLWMLPLSFVLSFFSHYNGACMRNKRIKKMSATIIYIYYENSN